MSKSDFNQDFRGSCNSNTSWVGGFDKSYGIAQPLYLQVFHY